MNKSITFLLTALLGICIASCGESAKDRQAREEAAAKQRADSIALVEKQKAMEQRQADSIANLEKRRERLAADSATRAELLPFFREEKNVPAEGMVTYKAKTAPKGHGQNSAYLSFYADNGYAKEISITVDYVGADWIYINSAIIDVDNETFTVNQGDDKGDKVGDNSLCQEWFTISIGSGLVNKLAEAKSIKIKFKGSETSKDITLTPAQVTAMVNTIKLYRAMGG